MYPHTEVIEPSHTFPNLGRSHLTNETVPDEPNTHGSDARKQICARRTGPSKRRQDRQGRTTCDVCLQNTREKHRNARCYHPGSIGLPHRSVVPRSTRNWCRCHKLVSASSAAEVGWQARCPEQTKDKTCRSWRDASGPGYPTQVVRPEQATFQSGTVRVVGPRAVRFPKCIPVGSFSCLHGPSRLAAEEWNFIGFAGSRKKHSLSSTIRDR